MSFSLVETWPKSDERSKEMPPWETKKCSTVLQNASKSLLQRQEMQHPIME